jgi:hypothetical protein
MGGVFWKIRPQQMNTKERGEYLIPDLVVAAICEAVRIEDMIRFKELGFTPIEIYQSVGQVGIATVLRTAKTKQNRPIIWTALKGAEIDLYRKLFPMLIDADPPAALPDHQADPQLEPAGAQAADDGAPILDGDFAERDGTVPPFWPGTDDPTWASGEEPAAEAPADDPAAAESPAGEPDLIPADALEGPAHELRAQLAAKAETYRTGYANSIHADKATAAATGRQAQFIASMFSEAFAPDTNARKEYHSALRWLWGVDSATKLSFCQARATLDWLLAGQDPDTNEYMLNDGVSGSARLVLRQVREKGQSDMFGEEE